VIDIAYTHEKMNGDGMAYTKEKNGMEWKGRRMIQEYTNEKKNGMERT